MALSLRPSTFSQGGGLIDDIDVTVTRARFVSYDFEGKSDSGPKLCILGVLTDADGNEHPQYWSAGDLQYFAPSEDPKNPDLNGITIVQVGEKTNLNGSTNAALFLNSLVQAGFPEDKLDEGDLRVLEGMVMHVNRVPQPKRSNLPQKPGQSDKAPMVLVCTAIKTLPGDTPKPNTTKAAAGKSTASTPQTNSKATAGASSAAGNGGGADPALVEKLTGCLIETFAINEVTSLKKAQIAQKLFATVDKGDPDRSKLVSLASKDEVLKSLDGFTFDGTTLTIG